MTGTAKGTGSVPLTDASAQAVETLLSSPDWQQRLAQARVQREKVLAERARLEDAKQGLTAPKKPWDRETPARPAPRDRPRADAVTVAATRADLLLPQVMRATRADIAAAAASPAGANAVPVDIPPRRTPDRSDHAATDMARAMARAAAAPKPAAAAPVSAASAVAPLVATDFSKARSLPWVVALAFAAGVGLGGGAFLWFGASAPVPSAGGASATPAASSPALSGGVAALPAGAPEPDTAAPAVLALIRPELRQAPAVLARPAAADRPAPAYGSPGAPSPEPVASPDFGIADSAEIRLPQGLAAPHLTARPDAFLVAAAQGEDRAPVAVPSLLMPLAGSEAMLARLAVPATGETLSYQPAGTLAPARLSLPVLAFPAAAGQPDAAAGLADAAALAPPPAPRALAGAAFADVPLRLLTSPRAASGAGGAAERALRDNGFAVAGTRAIAHKVNQTHVRYYYPDDRAAAEAVASTLGVTARVFAPPGASVGPGTVEVWIGGPAPTDPPTAAPAKTAATARKKKATASAAARRNAEQEQLRALRDRIVLQLQSGG